MATKEELKKLYKQTKYREILAVEDGKKLLAAIKNRIPGADITEITEKLLQVGWAHHQLGEYGDSIPIFRELSEYYPASSEIGESALRGLAHGRLQKDMDIEAADAILRRLPQGLNTDNIRMNQMIIAVRKGLTILAESVMSMIIDALKTVPYTTINGHIINNGALVLHEARNQEAVKPYLPILPGLMFVVIGIYEATGTAKNHIAGAEFRASQVCEATGWKKNARITAETSIELWRELVNSQDGARYQRNLEGAEAQLKKLSQ